MKGIFKAFGILIAIVMLFSIFSEYWQLLMIPLLFIVAIRLLTTAKKKSLESSTNKPFVESTSPSTAKKLPPAQHNRYVVLDIETTGFSPTNDRIIEIAANEYDNGQLVDQFHTYVNPGIHIPANITKLTGIRDEDVADAPNIQKARGAFLKFIGVKPIVGHNIKTFDVPFLNARINLKLRNKLIDTLELARKEFPGLPSYKLEYLNQVFQLGGTEHHRANSDVEVTHALYQACLHPVQYHHFVSDKEALKKIPVKAKQSPHSKVDIHSITPTNPDIVPHTPLTGKVVVFSGELSISRTEAMQLAVDAGAILKSHMSKKVDYLIVGAQDQRYVGETGLSNKQLYANTLIENGSAKLQVIDEKEFLKLAQNA